MSKVKKTWEYRRVPGSIAYEYQVNWTGKYVIDEKILMKKSIDIERVIEQTMWDAFLRDMKIDKIRKDLLLLNNIVRTTVSDKAILTQLNKILCELDKLYNNQEKTK